MSEPEFDYEAGDNDPLCQSDYDRGFEVGKEWAERSLRQARAYAKVAAETGDNPSISRSSKGIEFTAMDGRANISWLFPDHGAQSTFDFREGFGHGINDVLDTEVKQSGE